MLLYQAARAQVVDTVIRPALAEGKTVILDRYAYSTVAYQNESCPVERTLRTIVLFERELSVA